MLKFIHELFNTDSDTYCQAIYDIYINNMTEDIEKDIKKILNNIDNDIQEKIKELIKDIDPSRKMHFETLLKDFVIEKLKPDQDFQYRYCIDKIPEDVSLKIKKLLLKKGYKEYDYYYETEVYSMCEKETIENKGMIDN